MPANEDWLTQCESGSLKYILHKVASIVSFELTYYSIAKLLPVAKFICLVFTKLRISIASKHLQYIATGSLHLDKVRKYSRGGGLEWTEIARIYREGAKTRTKVQYI